MAVQYLPQVSKNHAYAPDILALNGDTLPTLGKDGDPLPVGYSALLTDAPITWKIHLGGGTWTTLDAPQAGPAGGQVTTIGAPVTGNAPTNATSSALEASRIAKNTAGTLYGLSGFNSKASGQYIQLFNSATLPADAAVPVLVQFVPAASPFAFDFGIYGRGFSTGIVACNSSTLATKTIGSADCWFDFQYV